MKYFPSQLKNNKENIDNFPSRKLSRIICYLRKDIYEYIIFNIPDNESSYFSFTDFFSKFSLEKEEEEKIKETVIKELQNLGWYTKLLYGNSGLYIYNEINNPPKACTAWEEI